MDDLSNAAGGKDGIATADGCSVAIRFLADVQNILPLQVAVVVCLDLLRNALAERSPQRILAAGVQHLLLYRCIIGAPKKNTIIVP